MPTIARDDIFLNLLLDIPQFRTSSHYMTLRPSGLRILEPNGRTLPSDSKIRDLSAQYLCLDINSQLYNDPGNGPADRGQRIIRRPPHCTSDTTVIAQNASQKVEREMIVEDFEDFGQFCIALNIVFQRSASSLRRARIFHEGFTRIAKSELETQAKGRPVRSATSLAANASDRIFWVGPELKVGVNIVVKRQEIFQPLPRECERDSCGLKTGPLHKFTLGINGQYNALLIYIEANSYRASYSHAIILGRFG